MGEDFSTCQESTNNFGANFGANFGENFGNFVSKFTTFFGNFVQQKGGAKELVSETFGCVLRSCGVSQIFGDRDRKGGKISRK